MKVVQFDFALLTVILGCLNLKTYSNKAKIRYNEVSASVQSATSLSC